VVTVGCCPLLWALLSNRDSWDGLGHGSMGPPRNEVMLLIALAGSKGAPRVLMMPPKPQVPGG
jgi:hypothetical protein